MSKTIHSERVASIRRWFQFTRSEQFMLGSILLIFVIGLCARWYFLRHQPVEKHPILPGMELER